MIRTLATLALFIIHFAAHAQDLPPLVRLIVPYSAGGGGDILARLTAKSLTSSLGTNIIVENKPGAGGVIAANAILQGKTNGELLFASGPSRGMLPHLYSAVTYESLKDISAVGPMPKSPNIIVVADQSPIADLNGLVEAAKKKPLHYGSAGHGSPGHMVIELLNGRQGTSFVHVPYKGSSPAITAILSGEIDFASLSYSSTNQFVKSGKLRVVAVLQPTRSKLLAQTPSVKEAGLGDVDSSSKFAMFVKTGTPQPIMDKIAKGLQKMQQDPQIIATLVDLGYEPWEASAQEVTDEMYKEYQLWGPVIKSLGIQPN